MSIVCFFLKILGEDNEKALEKCLLDGSNIYFGLDPTEVCKLAYDFYIQMNIANIPQNR